MGPAFFENLPPFPATETWLTAHCCKRRKTRYGYFRFSLQPTAAILGKQKKQKSRESISCCRNLQRLKMKKEKPEIRHLNLLSWASLKWKIERPGWRGEVVDRTRKMLEFVLLTSCPRRLRRTSQTLDTYCGWTVWICSVSRGAIWVVGSSYADRAVGPDLSTFETRKVNPG